MKFGNIRSLFATNQMANPNNQKLSTPFSFPFKFEKRKTKNEKVNFLIFVEISGIFQRKFKGHSCWEQIVTMYN